MNSIQYYLYGIAGLVIVFTATSLLAPLMPLIAVAIFCYIFYLTHQFITEKDEDSEQNWLQEVLEQEAKSQGDK